MHLYVAGDVAIALAFPFLLWLLATGGTRQGVHAVFAAWWRQWRRASPRQRVLMTAALPVGWTIALALLATWALNWERAVQEGAGALPLYLSFVVLAPRFSERWGRGYRPTSGGSSPPAGRRTGRPPGPLG